jgi:hypothetical protein
MTDSPRDAPKPEPRLCEKCRKVKPDTRYAPDVKLYLCNWCWLAVPPGRQHGIWQETHRP